MVDFDPGTMPHRPPMRLVDRLLDADERRGTASFRIPPGNLFLDSDGVFAREALAEVMAQAFMALSVWQAARGGAPPAAGYLVGMRGLRVHADAREGDTLIAKVEATDRVAQVAMVAGQVFRGETLLAEGELRLYTLPGESPSA